MQRMYKGVGSEWWIGERDPPALYNMPLDFCVSHLPEKPVTDEEQIEHVIRGGGWQLSVVGVVCRTTSLGATFTGQGADMTAFTETSGHLKVV